MGMAIAAGQAVLVLGVALALPPMPVPSVRNDLCYPKIFGSDNAIFAGRYPVADRAFDHRRYKDAFKAYYQYFFCFLGSAETVDPAAEDSGAAPLLRTSLGYAVDGNYRKALAYAESSAHRDTRFGEAEFIVGDLNFVLRDRRAAESAWLQASRNSGYPHPPDTGGVPSYVQASREMLELHRFKSR